MSSASKALPVRVVFTDGGKGGVGKTEVAVSLATWYRRRGYAPRCIDFGAEENAKGSLASFIPNAVKLQTFTQGAFDHFFEGIDSEDRIVLADMSAGDSDLLADWFHRSRIDHQSLHFQFTAVGITTNEPGAVNAILQSAKRWQDKADYLVVLNHLKQEDSAFHYWHRHPAVESFITQLQPAVIQMRARRPKFQAQVRDASLTLEAIAQREASSQHFRSIRRVTYAKRLLRQIYSEFDQASHLLLPSQAGLTPDNS